MSTSATAVQAGFLLTIYFECVVKKCEPYQRITFPQSYQTIEKCVEAGEMWQSFPPKAARVNTYACDIQEQTKGLQ